MENKKSNAYLIPLLISLVFGLGIWMGSLFTPSYQLNVQGKDAVNSKLNAVLSVIEDKYVDSVDHDLLIESSIEGMIQKLDPHSQYIPPKDLSKVNEQLDGKFGGIGIRFLIHDDTLVVTHILENSPSKKAGLLAGDRIIQVDDSVIVHKKNKPTNETVMSLLKGKEGSKVNLKVYRKGKIEEIKITRGSIPVSSIDANVMLTKEIGFIKVNSFTYNAGDEFVSAARGLKSQGMTKLILDLRNNGGGFMHAATTMLDEFFDSGVLLVYTEGRKSKKQEYFTSSRGGLKDVQIAVLINSLSASASEIVAGAIQDNDRGIILGRRSFGKGLVQDQQEFSDGSALRLTISRYYTPTGRCIQKPYSDREHYELEYYERYLNGELMNADSIKINDSLKYTTPKGKIVYGGGGIYPDIFIPNDTMGATYYLTDLYYANAFSHWTFKLLDSHRNKWKNFDDFNKSFDINDAIFDEFINYVENKLNVKKVPEDIIKSKNVIKNRLKAEIARHLFEENGYYKIYLKDDLDVQTAIKELKKIQ